MNRPLGELGRFAEPSLYILVSLRAGPKHGYAIMTDVEEISGSPIGPGHALRRAGPARAARPDRGARAGGRRRPYRLTGARRDDARGPAGAS